MSFHDFFHTFFGNRNGEDLRFSDDNGKNDDLNNGRGETEDYSGGDMGNIFFDFKMMSDPFELHNFVMKRMNEFFSAPAFGFSELLSNIDDFNHPPPTIKENVNPRDLYLKPEFKKRIAGENSIKDNGHQEAGDSRTWTSSYRKTVTLSDGTVKTEEVIRNADGTVKRTESTTLLDESNPLQLPFPSLGTSGIWGKSDGPLTVKDPKYDFLKPGYENSNANPGKVDKDLDKELSLSGIENLPSFSKNLLPSGSDMGISCTIKTVTTQNGITQTKEIVKTPNGVVEREETKLYEPNKSGFVGAVQDLMDLLFR